MSRLTREDIVVVAGKRFATFGYHGTSMRDLGDDLGILGSSIYAHIGGKHELLVAVVERAGEKFADVAETASAADTDPATTLGLLIRGHIDVLCDHRSEAKTFLDEATYLDPDDRRRVTRQRDAYEAVFRSTIRSGIEQGQFRSDLEVTVAGIYVLSILNAILRWYDPDGPMDRTRLAADMHEFVVSGLTG
ncbi:MAG: TetR family transcriptional regulator [Acidimicrobiia bacterium]|nr:TetR family transcriptional regulator [Acidimicrobiia bacterium]